MVLAVEQRGFFLAHESFDMFSRWTLVVESKHLIERIAYIVGLMHLPEGEFPESLPQPPFQAVCCRFNELGRGETESQAVSLTYLNGAIYMPQ